MTAHLETGDLVREETGAVRLSRLTEKGCSSGPTGGGGSDSAAQRYRQPARSPTSTVASRM
jgi:hypothetical protein